MFVHVSPFIRRLCLRLFYQGVFKGRPRIARDPMEVMILPINVAIFRGSVSVFVRRIMTSTTTNYHVGIRGRFLIHLFRRFIRWTIRIYFNFFAKGNRSICLRCFSTMFTVGTSRYLHVFLPVNGVVLCTKVRPGASFGAWFLTAFCSKVRAA